MVNSEVSKNPRGKNSLTAVRGGDRTRTILIQVGVAAVLIALIAAIGISIAVKQSDKNDVGPVPSIAAQPAAPDAVTASITDKGEIKIGKPGAKADIHVVADLQCPACKMFEGANGKAIEDAVNSGAASVRYNIIAFLDNASGGTRYSTRGANAAYCVAESDPTKFLPWLSSMYEQQPPENGTGLPDEQIVQIAQAAGYTDPAVAECITSVKYDKYIQKVTKDVMNSGIQSTPTVYVNDKQIKSSQELMQPDGLRSAIAAAAQ
ncbi:thioredoxin domain-containing protein [Nocardia vermiculata]|uniref:Thioredoxin domain-containing protein n=1 Tax=Nocardia vermiculata TaxID=257274 RepID=A0A846Y3J3_9NOCA|nr:thioredoxin domain-containing protein [Nocardia vermiculata]